MFTIIIVLIMASEVIPQLKYNYFFKPETNLEGTASLHLKCTHPLLHILSTKYLFHIREITLVCVTKM